MLSDEELYAILETFYRPTDAILISTIKAELRNFGFNANEIKEMIEDAIDEGYLKKITPIRVKLTKIGRELWKDADEEGLFDLD